jgi:antitoxin ParD1/3/4
MPTRNVRLTERHEVLIDALVGSGRYRDAAEVVGEGLRLVERREAEEAARLEALREAARVGVAALERGAYREFADLDELRAHLDRVAERAIAGARGR